MSYFFRASVGPFFSPFFPRCRPPDGGDGHDQNVRGGFVKGVQDAKRDTFYGHRVQAGQDWRTLLEE